MTSGFYVRLVEAVHTTMFFASEIAASIVKVEKKTVLNQKEPNNEPMQIMKDVI